VLARVKLRDCLAVENERLGEVVGVAEGRRLPDPDGHGLATARLIVRKERFRSTLEGREGTERCEGAWQEVRSGVTVRGVDFTILRAGAIHGAD
jgi:hypothetical protein